MEHPQDLRSLWSLGLLTVPFILPSDVRDGSAHARAIVELVDNPNVPFVVATSRAVLNLLVTEGCTKRVVLLRRTPSSTISAEEYHANRIRIRRQFGIPDNTLLIGMAGDFSPQCGYTRAVRVLQQLRHSHPCKLMILGSVDPADAHSIAAVSAMRTLATTQGLLSDLILPGTVDDIAPYVCAFDVYLNTNIDGDAGAALQHARSTGCPTVSTAAVASSQPAAYTSLDAVVHADSEEDACAYVQSLVDTLHPAGWMPPRPPAPAGIASWLWFLLARFGMPDEPDQAVNRHTTLFVTNNINVGGGARMLVDLVVRLQPFHRIYLCVLERLSALNYASTARSTDAPVFFLPDVSDPAQRTMMILHLADQLKVRNICFWDADVTVKLLLASVLQHRSINLLEVSSAQRLLQELGAAKSVQHEICMSAEQYLARLNGLVSWEGCETVHALQVGLPAITVVPQAIPCLQEVGGEPTTHTASCTSDLTIGACCQIARGNGIEYLLKMMSTLSARLPDARLSISGELSARDEAYRDELLRRIQLMGLNNVSFEGGHCDIGTWMRRLRVFVTVKCDGKLADGLPEALGTGLPVVIAGLDEKSELVVDGLNGFVVSPCSPTEMADRVEWLLVNPDEQWNMGQESLHIARTRCNMETVVAQFLNLLQPT
jgi:glycosyltransferase involved in cell wall biosynthesis